MPVKDVRRSYVPLPHPCDTDSLMGAIEAARRNLIIPVLVGPEEKIRSVAVASGIDISPYQIISTPHSHASAAKAVELASSGQAEAIMKGSLHTDEIMGAIVPVAAGPSYFTPDQSCLCHGCTDLPQTFHHQRRGRKHLSESGGQGRHYPKCD